MEGKDNNVLILLGGNLGEVAANFKKAISLLKEVGTLNAISGLYQSAPWGMESKDLFYNKALSLTTQLNANELLKKTQEVEQHIGRAKNKHSEGYESRVIDIDILFYNFDVLKSSTLEIPHPRLHLRNFTLLPLMEIAPNFNHPILKQQVHELLKNCPDTGWVKKVNE